MDSMASVHRILDMNVLQLGSVVYFAEDSFNFWSLQPVHRLKFRCELHVMGLVYVDCECNLSLYKRIGKGEWSLVVCEARSGPIEFHDVSLASRERENP
jgi:hypothetical protein